MNLLLSIIVPVYNVEKYLERCLDCILVQPFRNFEFILVNDGSTDNSLSICKRYEATNNRIVIVDKPNGGLSSARNAGLKVAKGNYVSFIDSDDFISSDFYEANMEFLEQNPDIDMMILPYCKYSDTDNVLYKNDPQTLFNKTDVLNYLFSNKYNCAVWRCIYKVDIFLYSRFAEGRLFEDGYILPEIAQCVSSLVISEVGCYYYVVREGSICNSTYSLRKRTQQLDTLRKILDYCMIKQIDSAIYIHYYFSYSYLIVKAVAQNNYQVLSAYIQDWKSKSILLRKALLMASFKYKIVLLLIMIAGFKVSAKVIGKK